MSKVCDIEGAIKYLEDIQLELRGDKSTKKAYFAVQGIVNNINKSRSKIFSSSSYAGSKRLNIHDTEEDRLQRFLDFQSTREQPNKEPPAADIAGFTVGEQKDNVKVSELLDVLDVIADSADFSRNVKTGESTKKYLNAISRLIKTYAGDQTVSVLLLNSLPEIAIKDPKTNKTIGTRQPLGSYNHKSNILKLSMTQDNSKVSPEAINISTGKIILHEIVHKLSRSTLKNNKKLNDEITKLRNRAIDLYTTKKGHAPSYASGSDTYGLSKNSEFVAEVLTSYKLQKLLADMSPTVSRGIVSRIKKIFKAILDKVKENSGISNDAYTLLDEAMEAVEAVMENDENLLPSERDVAEVLAGTKQKEESTQTPQDPNFDEDLNQVLLDKLKKLYPEINLSYTADMISEDENSEYQKQAVSDDKEIPRLTAVAKHLQEMYPAIRQKDIDTVLAKYGNTEVDDAITAVVNLDSNTDRTTLPFEYSLLYVDLLQTTTFMKNTISRVAKEKGLDRDKAKVALASNMAKYVSDGINGEPYTKETRLAKKVWDNIVMVFNAVFNSKNMLANLNERRAEIVAQRLMEGVNKKGITLRPKKGTELVDPSYDFKNQPFAAGVVYDVMEASKQKAIFTGSEALATQGNVYRVQGKNGTDLHDLDFALPSVEVIKDVIKELDKNYTLYEAYNFHVPKKTNIAAYAEKAVMAVPALMALKPLVMSAVKYLPSDNIVTQILVAKDQKIVNVKRFKGRGRIVSYDVINSDNKVVGSYEATVEAGVGFKSEIIKEDTDGVKAIVVDLIESGGKRPSVDWKSPNGNIVKVARDDSIFKAKNQLGPHIARDKDVIDANSFYNAAFIEEEDSDTEFQTDTGTGLIKGKANLSTKSIVINSLLQTQDTLPHEYAHHYIGMFRESTLVKAAIEKWGSEEALVQAIGEQAVLQKGEAWNWWKTFTDWLRGLIEDKDVDEKELLKNMLTDSFLVRRDLSDERAGPSNKNDSAVDYTEEDLDIWYKDRGKLHTLSNLASRPFEYQGQDYFSVEHAYQVHKSGTFDFKLHAKYRIRGGAGHKMVGHLVKTKTEGDWNIKLMQDLMQTSFDQNPEAVKLLVSTGTSVFTHKKDKGIWKDKFPELLSNVRDTFLEGLDEPETINNNENTDNTDTAENTKNNPSGYPFIVKGEKYTTNEGQTFAIDTISDWYTETGSPHFLLQGRGGTGKTTVISVLLDKVGITPEEVTFAAPTNKAKKVLADANSDSKFGVSPNKTIAQVLGLKPARNPSNGSLTFVEDEEAENDLAKVLVVDEASMVSSRQYSNLVAKAKQKGSRIIFMGDNAQMPPIGDNKMSPIKSYVFAANEDTNVRLNQLMRQEEGSPIILVTNQLIQHVDKVEKLLSEGKNPEELKQEAQDTLRFNGNLLHNVNDNGDGVVITNENEDVILDQFVKDFKLNPAGTKYIWYNKFENSKTQDKTEIIRNKLYSKEAAKEAFLADEPLMLNVPIMYDFGDVEGPEMLDNGTEYTVVSSKEVKDVKLTYMSGSGIHQKRHETNQTISYYELEAIENDTGRTVTFKKPFIQYSDTLKMLMTTEQLQRFIANEQKEMSSQEWRAYSLHDALAVGISHGYIINSHKAQGSTYDTVYTDFGNIIGQDYADINTIIKSMYVSASRPKRRLVVVDSRVTTGNIINSGTVTASNNVFSDINTAEADKINDEVNKCRGGL